MDGYIDCREDEQDVPDLHPGTIAPAGPAYQFPLITATTNPATNTAPAQ